MDGQLKYDMQEQPQIMCDVVRPATDTCTSMCYALRPATERMYHVILQALVDERKPKKMKFSE